MPNDPDNLERTLEQMSGNFLNVEAPQKDFAPPSRPRFSISFVSLLFIAEIILALVMAVVFYMKSTGSIAKEPPPSVKDMPVPMR